MSRKADPRPGRTKTLLSDALFELIQEKRWDRIRVQDILDRTGVGRSTFYAHFDSKFDLLTWRLPSQLAPISTANQAPDLLPLFTHVKEMRPIMLPLMSQPLLAEITDEFQRQMASSWTDHLTTIGIGEERRMIVAELLAGGFMSVAYRWLRQGCTPDPDTVAREFSSYAVAVIAAAS